MEKRRAKNALQKQAYCCHHNKPYLYRHAICYKRPMNLVCYEIFTCLHWSMSYLYKILKTTYNTVAKITYMSLALSVCLILEKKVILLNLYDEGNNKP